MTLIIPLWIIKMWIRKKMTFIALYNCLFGNTHKSYLMFLDSFCRIWLEFYEISRSLILIRMLCLVVQYFVYVSINYNVLINLFNDKDKLFCDKKKKGNNYETVLLWRVIMSFKIAKTVHINTDWLKDYCIIKVVH